MNFQESQVQAILKLLDDDDPDIAAGMRQKLFSMGEAAVRDVLCAAPEGSRAHREASRVLMRFREPTLEDRFRNLAQDTTGDIDLEEGALVLARFGYPDLDIGAYKTRLGRMAFELAPRVAPDDHPVRVIRTFNHFLFEEIGLRAARRYDPDDTYLNRVLERKRGWPIALSAVYLILARHLDLPMVGIAMPRHYVVKYKAATGQEIYIDPYHRGQILTPNECAELAGEKISDDLLPEATNRFTLYRMMNNLKHTYLNIGDHQRARQLDDFIQILQEST